MGELEIQWRDEGGEFDSAQLDKLRLELTQVADHCDWAIGQHDPNSKSAAAIDITTLIVSVLSTHAATNLVGVLKSYVQRNAGEIVIKRTGGDSVSIKSGDLRSIDRLAEKLTSRCPGTGGG